MSDEKPTPDHEPCSKSVLTLSPGGAVPCPGCKQLFVPRRTNHKYCSPQCRMLSFHANKEATQQDRDAKVRLLLRTASESIEEARQLLQTPPQ